MEICEAIVRQYISQGIGQLSSGKVEHQDGGAPGRWSTRKVEHGEGGAPGRWSTRKVEHQEGGAPGRRSTRKVEHGEGGAPATLNMQCKQTPYQIHRPLLLGSPRVQACYGHFIITVRCVLACTWLHTALANTTRSVVFQCYAS